MSEPKIIDTCPAYDVIEPTINAHRGFPELKAGDQLADAAKPTRHYKINSAVSYALAYGDDPIEAHNRAVSRGHATHWIGALGSSITAWKRPRETYIGVHIGGLYWFEGHVFEIVAESNNNLGLKLFKGQIEVKE